MKLSVLAADDDPLIRTLLSVALSTLAEVIEAADGHEALRCIRKHDFDVLLLDWDMPGKTGVELTRYVRARNSQVPIIMITAKDEREEVVEAIEAGVDDYLIKPFKTEVLCRRLENLCPGFRAEPEARESKGIPS